MKSLLFIGAHPDDETLCTGLFLKAKKLGFATSILICSEGKNGAPNKAEASLETQDILDNRHVEFETYCDLVRADYRQILNNPTTLLNESEELILEILKVLRTLRPQIVVTHMNNDYHEEHQVVHNTVKKALEIASRSAFTELGPKLTDTLLFEVDGLEMINNPDIYVDISSILEEKTRIIKTAYEERLGNLITMDTHRAKLRGARKKLEAAECYSLVPVRSTSYSANALKVLAELIE